MQWMIRNKMDCTQFHNTFDTKDVAEQFIARMGSSFQGLYEAVPLTSNPLVRRMLVEGLVAGDLRHIILPQVSIDQYVPGDVGTDNVVIAFFIKGVPEAVIPFRDFIMKCKGVVDVAYGDSDTIPNTSIIYAEMTRSNFGFDNLQLMMDQISLLSELDPEDFSVLFPTSNTRYPYSIDAIRDYFAKVNTKKIIQAQQDAISKSENEDEGDPEERNEAMIEHLIESFR